MSPMISGVNEQFQFDIHNICNTIVHHTISVDEQWTHYKAKACFVLYIYWFEF